MPDFIHEDRLHGVVCGIDEAGRGPWAGPVVAAAVIWPQRGDVPCGLNDSKKLSAKKREALYDPIMAQALVGIGTASEQEIDATHILAATHLAMRRACEALPVAPHHALVDGNQPPRLACPAHMLVGGDGLSLSIAAASIVAKVYRDRLMQELARLYPAYGFDRHAGYGTAQHRAALEVHGPCPAHRQSFAPIRTLLDKARAA